MAKLILFFALVIVGFALTSTATMYTVGNTAGWDLSTDVETWAKDKRFVVGDVLVFLYSSDHSVSEVTRENFQGCNPTSSALSNGNTTFALTKPGHRYFICGKKLHCFGGMKLHVNVEAVQAQAAAPAAAPRPDSGVSSASFPPHSSSKIQNPSAIISSSSTKFVHVGIDFLFLAFLGFMASFPMML